MSGIGNLTTTGPGDVVMGRHCSIGDGVTVIFLRSGTLRLGDYVSLGNDVRLIIDGGDVDIGDWTTLHRDCLVMSTNGVLIGAHCWFGQNSVIDGTGGLSIGDGVRVGMYSQIWTHVAAGEQIEGCVLFGATPTVIENDVWLVGTCTVGSGVTIGERTVALAGSNVTKSCPPHSTLAGSPAKVKEGLSFYRSISLSEKFDMLENWLVEIVGDATIARSEGLITVANAEGDRILFYARAGDFHAAKDRQSQGTALCCVETKDHVKAYTELEMRILKALAGNKARFYDRSRGSPATAAP